MLRPESNPKELNRNKRRMFIAIAFIAIIYFGYIQLTKEEKTVADDTPGIVMISEGDTTILELPYYDSAKIDSFFNSFNKYEPSPYEDSLHKAYGFDKMGNLDSPSSPLIDSLLKEFEKK